MIAADRSPAGLLAALEARGVQLTLRGIHLRVDAEASVLTAELIATLKQHKSELVHAVAVAGPCQKCGSPAFVDHSVHGTKSLRRDCSSCGRTWGFPTWHADRLGVDLQERDSDAVTTVTP